MNGNEDNAIVIIKTE